MNTKQTTKQTRDRKARVTDLLPKGLVAAAVRQFNEQRKVLGSMLYVAGNGLVITPGDRQVVSVTRVR